MKGVFHGAWLVGPLIAGTRKFVERDGIPGIKGMTGNLYLFDPEIR
jgi:hypothetical protein